MKKAFQVIGIICIVAVTAAVIYAGVLYGYPILDAKSQHARDLPTIEKCEATISTQAAIIDSLQNENVRLTQKVQLLEQTLSERGIQKQLLRRIHALEQQANNE